MDLGRRIAKGIQRVFERVTQLYQMAVQTCLEQMRDAVLRCKPRPRSRHTRRQNFSPDSLGQLKKFSGSRMQSSASAMCSG